MYSNGIWEHAASYTIYRPLPETRGPGAQERRVRPVSGTGVSGAGGPEHGAGLAADCAGVSTDWAVCSVPALDGAEIVHFYVFCLVSFVLYAFRSTGEPGLFDRVIYWGNLIANMLQPALFVHFAVSFSDAGGADEGAAAKARKRLGRRLLPALLYVPGAYLVGLQVWAIARWSATGLLSHRLEQIGVGYMAGYYVVAAVVFYRRTWGGIAAGAAATEVADAWNDAGGGAVHAAVRGAVSAGLHRADPVVEGGAAVPGTSSADLQLGDCALPADGCGPDLQARRDLYAGDGGAGGILLSGGGHHVGEWCMRGSPPSGTWGRLWPFLWWGCRSIR